ncbi:uncharacterized protein LOC128712331 [Anopheles marshallii]|uniref:uncharacterized protein LOC128712331 n=1 Tax=Anopheles marshallii TaxID=1521116 RepID=UPI00237B6321|nr:uncharacterized protein LOC128712331 [Anopheles marshallii]
MDAYSKLDYLKPLIRSMVMSHRNKTVCIQELQRDFQDIEGFPIPYAQLGFESVFALLHAMPDIVKVSNNNGIPVVTHVSTPATEHVEQLIQRSCHRRRGRGYKPRHPPNGYRFRNCSTRKHRFEQSYPTLIETIAPKRPIVEAETCVTPIKGDGNNNIEKFISPSKQPTANDSNASMGETCEHVDGCVMSTKPFCDMWDSINMIDLPSDVMGLSHSILKVDFTHYFAEKAETNVRIMYVLNPNRVWLVSVLQDKTREDLNVQMQEFYRTIPRDEWYVEANKVQHGMYCAAPIDQVWHRARIVGPLIGRKVKIFFIDTGSIEVMDYKHIRYLYKVFGNIPAQAIRASLAGLIPKTYAWTRTESECLTAKIVTVKRAYTAYTLSINHKLGVLDIILKDENNIINEQFATATNARWTGAVYMAQGPEAYRNKLQSFNEKYPSFFCIEEGHFPTVAELRMFLDRDFDYEELYTRLPHSGKSGVVENVSRASNEQIVKLYGIVSAVDEGDMMFT